MSVWIAGRLRDTAGRARVWELRARGMVTAQIAQELGTSSSVVNEWVAQRGGVRPTPSPPPSGRYLSLDEREVIAVRSAAGASKAQIARARPGPQHDRPGARAQRQPVQERQSSHPPAVPRWAGATPGRQPQAPSEAGEAPCRRQRRAARLRTGETDVEVVARADRQAPAGRLPRPAGDARESRDDLPGDLRAVPRSAQA